MPEIGQTISHYKIVEQFGRRDMGEAHLAEDLSLDRKVALKFLPDVFTSNLERTTRFEREAKLLASLNHPNITAIYGLEESDGIHFLVLELIEGDTLADHIVLRQTLPSSLRRRRLASTPSRLNRAEVGSIPTFREYAEAGRMAKTFSSVLSSPRERMKSHSLS